MVPRKPTLRSIRGFLLAAVAGAGTWASQRGHRGSLREMSTYRKHRGQAAATIPPPEGESQPSPCSTPPPLSPPRRFAEDVVTDDDDGDAPAPAPLCCWCCFPRSNRSSAVFTFSIVHTLWYVVVVAEEEEGAAGAAQGFVAEDATGNRFRSLGDGGHACFGRDSTASCLVAAASLASSVAAHPPRKSLVTSSAALPPPAPRAMNPIASAAMG